MFFNVDDVRKFLVDTKEVFTIRGERKRVGNDIAVKGSYTKHKTIAKIFIEKVLDEPIISADQLVDYIERSGLYIRELVYYHSAYGEKAYEHAKHVFAFLWLELAHKLSGGELYLYKVSIRDVK